MAFSPNYYGGYQNPQMLNPMVANQQARLQQMEMQYPQFSQQPVYQQNIPQSQQMQTQQLGLNGRIVDDISEVTINEVSSDKNYPSVFLKRDQTEMYLKEYNSNGLIDTIRYTRVTKSDTKDESKETKSFEDMFTEFSIMFDDKLKAIDEKLNQALMNQTITAKNGGDKV